MMKAVLLLVALAIAIGYFEGGKAKAEEISPEEKKCMVDSGVSKDELAALERAEVPTTRAGKCYLACHFKLTETFKNGKYDAKGATESHDEDPKSPDYAKIKAMSEACEKSLAKESKADECELAAKALACEIAYMKKVGLI